MNHFTIVLNQSSPQQVYHGGETIRGAVEFTLAEPRSYDLIKVTFFGRGHVEWTSGRSRFLGNERYVEQSLVLWSPQQSSDGTIGPGSFSYPFQFVIPLHAPSSFSYQNPSIFSNGSAYISYEIEARAVTGMFRVDHVASAPILITQLTSISGRIWAKPIRQVKRKEVGCLWCASGDVEFIAKLPRTAFCVTNRDVIPLTVDVQNNSARMIHMRAKITKCVSLFVRGREDISKEIVAEIYSKPIQPRTSYLWNPANWIVPALPPTLLGSRIIHVDYILEVSAIIPKAVNLRCDMALLMANLPFRNLENASLGAVVSCHDGSDVYDEDLEDDKKSSERDALI